MQKKRVCLITISKTSFFSISFFEIQDITQNKFLRCQLSYFALANIRLHRYDSSSRFILLLQDDMNLNPDSTNVYNNNIPLNILPFYKGSEPTMPFRWNSCGCYKAPGNSKLKIFKIKGLHILHLKINSLLPKMDEIRFITKHSNASIIGISESKLDWSILNSELDIEE